jgi:hypothetical protein
MSDSTLGSDLEVKLRRFVEARTKRDEDKAAAEKSEKEYREQEAELWDELEDSPIEGAIKVNLGPPYGVVAFQPKETYYGRILDEEKALDYFERTAQVDEYTAPKIVKGRVNELVRECLEAGRPTPEGIDFYAQRYVSITKKKSG